MTPFVWMFIKTYEALRTYILDSKALISLIQMEYSAFEEATVPICSFVLKNGKLAESAYCFRLSDFKGGMEIQKKKVLEAIANKNCGYFYESSQDNFSKIPGSPIAYWVSEKWLRLFECSTQLSKVAKPRVGQNTGNNERFLRFWQEVPYNTISFGVSHNSLSSCKNKWIPYSKGGAFRRWYGNFYYVINWENDGKEIKDYAVIRNNGKHWSRYIQNLDYICCEGVTWSDVSSSKFACRYLPEGFICDVKGSSAYPNKELLYPYLAFLNSKITYEGLKILAPTISFQTGDIGRLPFIVSAEDYRLFEDITKQQVTLAKADWDSFETSWDFSYHPLVLINNELSKHHPKVRLSDAFAAWETVCSDRFNEVKHNEEILNRTFISLYGLNKEMSYEVDDSDIVISKANISRDIRSLISYAVGCLFGRYSLDSPGVAYAGGEWDATKYRTVIPDKDNIIPICDDDYFDDDITGRFIKWVETVFGRDTLEENLRFIADALGGKSTPRESLRNYFIIEYYSDHCNTYSVTGGGKRPIYWLFDSGKKNGFKALIYMHRYQRDLLARMRTDYVHEQQERYRTQLTQIGDALTHASGSEAVKLGKAQKKIQEQSLEIQKYEEKIHHLADQNIEIDLDDGVKHNYALFEDVLAKIK